MKILNSARGKMGRNKGQMNTEFCSSREDFVGISIWSGCFWHIWVVIRDVAKYLWA